jgi:hypothetical protein
MTGKYFIHSYYGKWRVSQTQIHDGHTVQAFIGEYDTWEEAKGVVSIELQGVGYPYHTEHFLYHREACS